MEKTWENGACEVKRAGKNESRKNKLELNRIEYVIERGANRNRERKKKIHHEMREEG